MAAAVTAACLGATVNDTRLADAAMHQDRPAVESLLKLHADVNVAQPDGTTALHWAAHSDDVAMAQELIRAGANIKTANRFGATPLSLAATNGSAAMIEALLKAGENPNAVVSDMGDTALMLAARTGKPDALEGVARTSSGQTWRRSEQDQLGGTNGSHVGRGGKECGSRENTDRARRECECANEQAASAVAIPNHLLGSVSGGRNDSAAVCGAAERSGVRTNLDRGGRGRQAERDGCQQPTAGRDDQRPFALAKFLLEHGADPNAADDKGRGPLYAAIDMRNLEWSTRPAPPEKDTLSDLDLIKALLDHGANPNARLTKRIPLRGQPSFDGRWANAIGATPLWRAAQSDDVTVMRLLKDRGADPSIATNDHTTVLMIAAGVGWSDGQSHGSQADAPEALKLCLEWGGDVNAVNDEGYTALHGASFRGANEVVQFLVDHGAKMDVKSKEGRLPVNMAEGMHIGPGGWVEHDDTVALFHKLMLTSSAQKQ